MPFPIVACLWTLCSIFLADWGCLDFGWVYSVVYTHAPGLCAILISRESSFWKWSPYTFFASCITDTPKTSPSSQEASESSQGFQRANMVPGHNEEQTPLEHVAECERPNKGKSLNVCCELYTVHIIIKCPPNARMHGYGYGCLTNAQTGVHRCMNERLRQTGTGVWQILKPASDRMSMDMESY